jgi:hypothetical protein
MVYRMADKRSRVVAQFSQIVDELSQLCEGVHRAAVGPPGEQV